MGRGRRAGRGRQAARRRDRLRPEASSPRRRRCARCATATTRSRPARGQPEIFDEVRKAQCAQVPRLRGLEDGDPRPSRPRSTCRSTRACKVERKLFMRAGDRPAVARAQRYVFFAERQAGKIPDVAGRHADAADREGRRHRRRHDGRRHRDELPQRRHSGDDRRDRSRRRSTAASPSSARTTSAPPRRAGSRMPSVEQRMGCSARRSTSMRLRRLRPRHRGGVREHGRSRRRCSRKLDKIAKPGAILATNTSYLERRRDRRGDQAAARTCIGLHFFSPANVMRLLEIVRGEKTVEAGDRHLDAARASKIGKIAVAGRRLPRLRRQPHAGAAPARGAEADPRRRHALGRRPRALRLRLADGAVRDERPRRPRHRLVEGDVASARRSATCSARWTAAARRPAPASTTTTRTATPSPRRWSRRSSATSPPRRASTARTITDEEILERCIYPMINEGAKILEEGKAHPRLRHRHRLDQRLRLAGLSRRPDVLRRPRRPGQGAGQDEGVRGDHGRRFQAGAAAGEGGR